MFHKLWRKTWGQQGVTLMAALFFIVVIALFGLLAVRFVSMGEVGSAEAYRYSQARFAAFAGRELHFLWLDTNGTSTGPYGWDGAHPPGLTVERCSVERVLGDVNASLPTGLGPPFSHHARLFRLKGACGGGGEAVARVWEAVFNRSVP